MREGNESLRQPKEVLLWSIAFPGFGQFLNKKYAKGIILIVLEFVININGNFNTVIINSFYGDIQEAIRQTNFQWLLFYPCVYFFSIWDAYKDAGGGREKFSYIPFVTSAWAVTIGLIYSTSGEIGNIFGTIWFPMMCVIPGIIVGWIVKKILKSRN